MAEYTNKDAKGAENDTFYCIHRQSLASSIDGHFITGISNLIDTQRSSMASKNYSRRSSFVKVDGDETQSGTLGKTAETRELEDSENHNIIQLHQMRHPDERHGEKENEFLAIVSSGIASEVEDFLENNNDDFDTSCKDELGRSALFIAADANNMAMVEVLVKFEIAMIDTLLYAIRKQNVSVVKMILIQMKAQKKMCKHLSTNTGPTESDYDSEMTPIILAAHVNNYEILKLLLFEGTSLKRPHDVRCGCEVCISQMSKDSLRFSKSRLNLYKALACPYLIALSSEFPIRTAFKLSFELRELSQVENEFRSDYEELSVQCEIFAKEVLDQTRSSKELQTILNYSDETDALPNSGILSALRLAVHFNQKHFVAQPNCQQLVSTLWYEGVYGWRRMHWGLKLLYSLLIGLFWPMLCIIHILFPKSSAGQLICRPFMKFIVGTASYLTFLALLVLASQVKVDHAGDDPGPPPSTIEWILLPWIISLIAAEIGQLWSGGANDYVNDRWNVMDFFMNSLYLATISTKLCAYLLHKDIPHDHRLSRVEWDPLHPTLISEAHFSVANIFSFLRLIYLFNSNVHMGPIQISLGRMLFDISKFLMIWFLVLFAFANGLNQLYYKYGNAGIYTGDSPHKVVHEYEVHEGHRTYGNTTVCYGLMCEKQNNAFSTLFHAMESLYWSCFGLVNLYVTDLEPEHFITKWVGATMFGVYNLINVIVLINVLIAMMNNSYQFIADHADIEWKFARSKLWLTYFEESSPLPPPFNIIPTLEPIYDLFETFIGKSWWPDNNAARVNNESTPSESQRVYQEVIHKLIRRYIQAKVNEGHEKRTLTENDVSELKQDLTTFRSKVIDDVRTATPYSKQKNAKDARSKLQRMSKMAALNQSPTSKNMWKLRQGTLALASGKTFDCSNRSSGEESVSDMKYKSDPEE